MEPTGQREAQRIESFRPTYFQQMINSMVIKMVTTQKNNQQRFQDDFQKMEERFERKYSTLERKYTILQSKYTTLQRKMIREKYNMNKRIDIIERNIDSLSTEDQFYSAKGIMNPTRGGVIRLIDALLNQISSYFVEWDQQETMNENSKSMIVQFKMDFKSLMEKFLESKSQSDIEKLIAIQKEVQEFDAEITQKLYDSEFAQYRSQIALVLPSFQEDISDK